MADPFIGQIFLVGYPFAMRGYALCEGQIQSIAQNTALFSLIGTIYGGNGQTTFALPDLRGRTPIGQGQGPGLSTYPIGQAGGTETNTLNATQMPAHTHTATLFAEDVASSTATPAGNLLSQASIYAPPARGPNRALSSESVVVDSAGGNSAVNNMQPFLVMNYQIALVGLFPSRQ